MINIDFSPNRIQDAFKANEEVIDNANNIERFDLPNHEDISHELSKAKGDMDSLAKDIESSAKSVKIELSSLLENDFEYKFSLFVQLLSNGLTEESFPIKEWIEEKEKLDDNFNSSHFSFLKKSITKCENQEIKDLLIYEYLTIQKHCLNSYKSFKYMSGTSFIKELHELMAENSLKETFVNEKLKNQIYSKEKGLEYISSQANYWRIYSFLKDIKNNKTQIVSLLSDIKENEIKDFVTFLGKTDLFFKRNNRNYIECFKQEPLREFLYLFQDNMIKDNFFTEFIMNLDHLNEKSSLTKGDHEVFDFVIKELVKGYQYFTLSNKFVKKLEKIKTIKI